MRRENISEEKNNTHNKNGNRNSNIKLKKRAALFIKSFFIAMAVFVAVIFFGIVIIKSIVKPPDIPIVVIDMSSDSGPAFLPPDGDEEDRLIGNGLHAPEGFTTDDRKDEFYTFLIVGLDGGINTDTIIIASYDGINKEANVISVPRDSKVNVKRKVKKINSAYPAGTLNGGGREGGIDQLKKEVKTIIGFIPDFYVCVDLDAFIKIVDAVGGINIYVPFDMEYDDDDQDMHINIKKGEQILHGAEALKFARYRKGNYGRDTISDYQRMENQQEVIKAVLSRLLKPANILKIPEFINIFTVNVYSDIKPENMLWFADQLNKIKGTDALSTYTMPTSGGSGPDMYYEYLDKQEIVKLVNKTINPYKKDIEAGDLDIIAGD